MKIIPGVGGGGGGRLSLPLQAVPDAQEIKTRKKGMFFRGAECADREKGVKVAKMGGGGGGSLSKSL